MKCQCLVLFSALFSLVTSHQSLVTAVEAAQLLVGTAKLDLTPPGKPSLAGYSHRRGRPANGIHDPPFIRALVIQTEDTTVALASCDLLIIDELLFDAVKKRLAMAQSPTPTILLLAATHTHSGPGAYGQKFLEKISMGHFDPAVFEFLSSRIAQAIVEASAHMQPVTMSYTRTSTTDLVVNRMDPNGVVDSQLIVLAFYDQHHNPVAVMVNFSAHATTLGVWNRHLSADYPGVLAQIVEERYPASLCLFFAGAVGDQAPVKRGNGFERAQWLGRELADKVFTLLEQFPQDSVSTVLVDQRLMPLPPARLRIGPLRLPPWMSQPFVDDDATLLLIAMGKLLLIGVPCDLAAELGLELKSHALEKGFQPFLIGFANDYIGYCLPERLYWTDHYEASLAFNGPTTGPMLVDVLKQMIDKLGVR